MDQCQSSYNEVKDWLWDIYEVPELEELIAFCVELEEFFNSEFSTSLYDLYTFFVQEEIWEAPYPECTYKKDLKLKPSAEEELTQHCSKKKEKRNL